MASLIKGIPVILYEKTRTGTDAFNAPVYTVVPVKVDNVLISPVSTEDLVDENGMTGRRAVCEISIPKKNTNDWENTTVEFLGQKWRTYGFVQSYLTENVPLDWDRKVRAERYG